MTVQEPAFRELCRRHGCDLAYTPMFNARIFADQGGGAFTPGEGTGSDRPLVVQFAGHEPASLLAAGKLVQDRCDAVDINLGCPQRIAKRGRFGAYLLEEYEPCAPAVGESPSWAVGETVALALALTLALTLTLTLALTLTLTLLLALTRPSTACSHATPTAPQHGQSAPLAVPEVSSRATSGRAWQL